MPDATKPTSSTPDPLDAIAKAAVEQSRPDVKPEERDAALGGELLAALKREDKAAVGRLLQQQIRIALNEAGRGKNPDR